MSKVAVPRGPTYDRSMRRLVPVVLVVVPCPPCPPVVPLDPPVPCTGVVFAQAASPSARAMVRARV